MEPGTAELVVLAALGSALGWLLGSTVTGPRGAGVAGAIFGLVLARLTAHPEPLMVAAFGAIAFSFGGALAAEQHLRRFDRAHTPAEFGWALFGLSLKGTAWIVSAALWLGIAAGFRPYRLAELIGLGIVQWGVGLLGTALLNRPHRPPEAMPRLYFSDADDPEPEPESWAGLWLGTLVVLAYLVGVRRDWFALGLAAFGTVGGLGWIAGKWAEEWARTLLPKDWIPWIDLGALRHAIFGAIVGGALAGGWRFLEDAGIAAGRYPLPRLELPVGVAVALVYVPFFVGSILYVPLARGLLSSPFGEALFWLPIALAERAGPQMLLAGILAAGAAVANVRPYFCGEILTFGQGMVAALALTALSVLLGWRWETASPAVWLAFLVGYHLLLSGIGRAVPNKELPPEWGYWRRLNGAPLTWAVQAVLALALLGWLRG